MLRGCVPKKLMVYGGEFQEAFRDSKAYGYVRLACLFWSMFFIWYANECVSGKSSLGVGRGGRGGQGTEMLWVKSWRFARGNSQSPTGMRSAKSAPFFMHFLIWRITLQPMYQILAAT